MMKQEFRTCPGCKIILPYQTDLPPSTGGFGRFEFYPGKQYNAIYYVNSVLLPEEKFTHVHVYITFERE